MSAVYAVFVGFVIYRKMTLAGMTNNIKNSMVTSGVVMILLFFILMVSRIMVTYQVPQQLTEFIFSFTTNKWLVLLMLNVILLLMGIAGGRCVRKHPVCRYFTSHCNVGRDRSDSFLQPYPSPTCLWETLLLPVRPCSIWQG